MLPIHTILHPTDFSEPSRAAFQLACALARDSGARLIVLHVVPPPVILTGEGLLLPPPPQEDEELIRKQLQQLTMPGLEQRLEHQLSQGDPATEIVQLAAKSQCDLIVMGTHGRTGLGRLLMGSVAEQVMRKAPCPVLTVKTPSPLAAPSGEGAQQQEGR